MYEFDNNIGQVNFKRYAEMNGEIVQVLHYMDKITYNSVLSLDLKESELNL